GQRADVILGQPDEFNDLISDTGGVFVLPKANVLSSSPDTIRTPLSLAWDGTNLYVADPFDRRVLAFTVGAPNVPINGITNAASQSVYALGAVNFGGSITADNTLTVTIKGAAGTSVDYKYTVVKDDTLPGIAQKIADLINGKSGGTPDPNVLATANPGFNQVVLTSKIPGPDGNNISYSVTTAGTSSTTAATITAAVASSNLTGGTSAAEVAPGTLVTIMGNNLSDIKVAGQPNASNGIYPGTLGGVEVYFDGIKAPLLYVSPTQIN